MSPTSHQCVNRSGMHAVDADRVPAQFGGERARHPGDCVLARGVVHHERLHLDAGGGADQDDRATTAAVDDLLARLLDEFDGFGEIIRSGGT